MEETPETMQKLQDKHEVLAAYIRETGIARHHIISYNHFINTEIKNIVKANDMITSDEDPRVYLKYLDVRVGQPNLLDSFNVNLPSTPHECRLRDLNYSAPITVDVEYIRNNQRIIRKDVPVGRMPIMVRSSNCVLRKKSKAELEKVNECPYDCGGYFIINGQEKVILMQEQIVHNRIIVEKDMKDCMVAVCNSYTSDRKTKTKIVSYDHQFYLRHNMFRDDIPIVVVFKAMGITSDIEIMQMISLREDYLDRVVTSIEECQELGIFTSKQALKYLHSKRNQKSRFSKSPLDDMRDQLAYVILAHVQIRDFNFEVKAIYMALMIRKIISAELDNKMMDNKDFYGNKRVELAGSLLAILFEDLFKNFNSDLKAVMDKMIPKKKAGPFDIVKYMKQNVLTTGLAYAISSGSWIIKRFKMERYGVTQVLARLSYISTLSMMTRVHSQFEKTRKISGPRSVRCSQWGMICPNDTPEGESCGLVKTLALTACITMDVPEEPIIRWLLTLGVEDIYILSGVQLHDDDAYTVFVNGTLVGIVRHPTTLVRYFRMLRRKGYIDRFVSIAFRKRFKYIQVCCDSGRLSRPCIIVQNGKSLLTQEHIEDLKNNLKMFDTLVKEGLIEFLDVNEENDCLIAVEEKMITTQTTHLEIEPYIILGLCVGLIPFANHNQSPRNTYQCAMGKQAMGVVGYNQRNRIDTILYNMVYPQKPLVSTRSIELSNYDKLPAGVNAIVAVMSFNGYDVEDALILNKASVDRGFGRCLVYRSTKCSLKKHPNQTQDKIMGPSLDATTKKPIWKHEILDSDGIATPGEMVKDKQIFVNRFVPSCTETIKTATPTAKPPEIIYLSAEVGYKGLEPSYIDKVMLSTNSEDELIVKLVTRQSRTPEIGDKFSSRHGQKGVVGILMQQEDMPFNDQGICPDIIMNPHGFPSRMTVGKLMEVVVGKAACASGKIQDASPFKGIKLDDFKGELGSKGYSYLGKDFFYNPMDGEPLEAYIFCGPIYYQRLKHMVQDKLHVRARGSRVVLTRQPTEGRSKDGGLRLGEMERDCLISYGASMLLLERLMISSDACNVDVCNECGMMGYNGWCPKCESSSAMSTIMMPYACKLLFQEIQSINVVPRITLKDTCS